MKSIYLYLSIFIKGIRYFTSKVSLFLKAAIHVHMSKRTYILKWKEFYLIIRCAHYNRQDS